MVTKTYIEEGLKDLGEFYHNIHLPFGLETRPGFSPARGSNYDILVNALPSSLDGMTVLDLGCNAGAFSIEAKKRGASRVIGVDYSNTYIKQAVFCSEVLGLSIEYIQSDVVHFLESNKIIFDYVIFVGTLYHLVDPIRVPCMIGRICKKACIVETVGVVKELRHHPENIIQLPRPKITHSGSIWMNMSAMNHIFLDFARFSSSSQLFDGSRIAALYSK